MTIIHKKIVQEIVKEYKEDPNVIAINVLGSVATNTERPDSDVDIEVITVQGEKWGWESRRKYDIDIDFVTCPKDHLEYQVEKYPFLCHINLHKKTLYDPKGFMKKMKRIMQDYMDEHPEVVKFWEDKLRIMRENKSKGQDPKDARKSFDEAEMLFSKEHKITRNYFRK